MDALIRPRVTVSVRRGVAAGAAICAVAAVLFATGAFNSGTSQPLKQTSGRAHTGSHAGRSRPITANGLTGPSEALRVDFNRSGGALTSIAVTATPMTANVSTEVEVYAAAASATPGFTTGPVTIVYQKQVPLTAPSDASSGQLATWSGTLSPNDWNGGCQPDLRYSVELLSVGPGASLADVVSGTPPEQAHNENTVEHDGTGWFSC